MLWFKNIEIEGFGPYKEKTIIAFPSHEGVTLVYGENMRGKTSLLNAIRYSLFGKVIGRGSKEISLHKISNSENASEGKYGFKVTLTFSYNNEDYELVRECKLRNEVEIPQSDMDYSEENFLRKNGTVLSPEDKENHLARIMPESVSRFFLFDGELLDEYEELLSDDSTMGQKIRESIERILGVPILTNARGDVRELLQNAQKEESKAAQRDQKTRELGNLLANNGEQKLHQENELKRLLNDYERLKGNKKSLEEEMRKTQRVEDLIMERDKLQEELPKLEEKRNEKEIKLKELMSRAWQSVIGGKIDKIRKDLSRKIENMEAQLMKKAVKEEMIKNIRAALDQGNCPTCLRSMDADALKKLENLSLEVQQEQDIDEREINRLRLMFANFSNFQSINSRDLIKEISENIDDIYIETVTKMDRISEIEDSIGDKDTSNIKSQRFLYDQTIKELTILEEGIKAQRTVIVKIEESLKKLQSQLDKISGMDISKERKRRELYNDLYSLFNDGVAMYREQLRSKVEVDASKLFIKMTTEPDYTNLSINENYGLTIVHRDNKTVPIRSAGAEQIVALSLIGALQKNTPLRGPVIMDSPFIRLDEQHKRNVLKSLEIMAPQVMLLVFEGELKPEIARDELLGRLKAEYKLQRLSARHTEIIEK
ncbi:AAA family ATPase [Cytobacillus sp. NJ13]|nr:AAA family ATPase [Cytobacillus sp. NJ13]